MTNKQEIIKDTKKQAVKILKTEDYTNLFCITLKNAITSNRLILASTFLSLNAGVSYDDLLKYAKTACGREWNASNRAFFSQPIRAGRNLFNKYNKDESFLKIVNAEGDSLEAKAEALVELLAVKKITVNKLLRAKETKAEETKAEETKAEETKAEETKAEEVKAEEVKAEEVKAEETKAETIEEKIFNEINAIGDKYRHNPEAFSLALLSQLEFLHGLDKLQKLTAEYVELAKKAA